MPSLKDHGQTLLRFADLRAERAVSVARMAGAVGMLAAVSYFSDPADKLVPETARVVLTAQMSLGLLFLGGLAAYLAIRFGRWRAWMAFATVTLDSAIVLVNLWMALRANHLPGNFLSAFPAAGGVTLVLVTSSLRFRPSVQIYTAVLMVAGIVALTAFTGDLGYEDRIPLSGVLAPYFGITGNAVRLVITFGTAAILVIGAVQGRRLLLQAVEETRRRANLGRYLPAELAPILATRRIDLLQAGRRSPIALLVIDIRNSTAMEESLAPTELTALISEFRDCVTAACTKHGGVIDKFIGDGAFLAFGIIEPKPDDALRALACARDLLDGIAAWNRTRAARGQKAIAVGVGVHYGEAFIGAIGNEDRLEFTVLGDTVNVVFRLEQATKQTGTPVVVSRDALLAAGEPLDRWTFLGEERLRGRVEPVAIYAPAGFVRERPYSINELSRAGASSGPLPSGRA